MPRKSNRRELIIDVATTRFLISGYDVVTVDELCELTASTKGSFYHFFTNKESLAVDVVNHVWHQTQSQMVDIFTSDLSPGEMLKLEIERIAGNYLRFDGKRYFIGCPVGTLAVGLRGRSPKLTRRLNFALTHMRQYYLKAFENDFDFKGIVIDNTGSSEPAVELADRFQISLQGLSTLGKTSSNSSRIREMSQRLSSAIET